MHCSWMGKAWVMPSAASASAIWGSAPSSTKVGAEVGSTEEVSVAMSAVSFDVASLRGYSSYSSITLVMLCELYREGMGSLASP